MVKFFYSSGYDRHEIQREVYCGIVTDRIMRGESGTVILFREPWNNEDLYVEVVQPNGVPSQELLGSALTEVLSRLPTPSQFTAEKNEKDLVEIALTESELKSKRMCLSSKRKIEPVEA